MRLARLIALAGLASRRRAEELIRSGFVQVNALPVLEPAFEVDAAKDVVFVDGQKAKLPEHFAYYILNKPKGFVTSTAPQGHRSIFELLPRKPRLVPAGRLDLDSEGLIILTNDGDLVNQLTHPRFRIPQTYYVEAEGNVSSGAALERLNRGVRLAEGKATGRFRLISPSSSGRFALEVMVWQGINRQVRRMLAKVGLKVRKLLRTRVGTISLAGLPAGKCRQLKAAEVAALLALAGQ